MAKKKKRLDASLMPGYIPGVVFVTPQHNIDYPLEQDQIDNAIKSIPNYMPMWKAWLLYSAYTAGLPMGHESAGAAFGAATAKKMGFRAIIGGGIGYVAAIVIVGTLATLLDPFDYYEGGADLTPAEMKAAGSMGLQTMANEFVDPTPIIRGRLNPLGLRTGWQ
jgi:hypothetical protein